MKLVCICDECKFLCPSPKCLEIRAYLAVKTPVLKNNDKIFELTKLDCKFYFVANNIKEAEGLVKSGKVYEISYSHPLTNH
jgi:hypothetical protein